MNTEIIEQNTSLSLIENLPINLIQTTMVKINNFQGVIQKNLREGSDYGLIPGCGNKKTLLKPGAEKVLMLLGITSKYELIEKVQDYNEGFFAFTVRCILLKNDSLITEGLGHCNTREKKYQRQDAFTLANTCLKMAKKRAQIDATLAVASLSEIFTQDLEDIDLPQQRPPAQQQTYNKGNNGGNGSNKPSEKQLKYFHSLCKDLGYEKEVALQLVSIELGREISSSKEISFSEMTKVIDFLKRQQEEKKSQPEDEAEIAEFEAYEAEEAGV